jgi:hypothetical protein
MFTDMHSSYSFWMKLARNQILELFLYCSKLNLKNLLVQTRLYGSGAAGPVLIVRTAYPKKYL